MSSNNQKTPTNTLGQLTRIKFSSINEGLRWLKIKINEIDTLVRENKFYEALNHIQGIHSTMERNKGGNTEPYVNPYAEILEKEDWIKSYIVRKNVIEMGVKYTRILIIEIAERCKFPPNSDTKLIVEVIQQMIEKRA